MLSALISSAGLYWRGRRLRVACLRHFIMITIEDRALQFLRKCSCNFVEFMEAISG